MPTNAELKALTASQITDKTLPQSIARGNVAARIDAGYDYTDQEIDVLKTDLETQIAEVPIGPEGPQGIQGNQGIQGVPGPVGPAGLEWKGMWISGASYVEDDAVGFEGASYFCISNTSGFIEPNEDAEHWALLASQGADGIPGEVGPQGPTGPQGIPGIVPPLTVGNVIATGSAPYPELTFGINNQLDSGSVKTPNPENLPIGKTIYLKTTGPVSLRSFDNTAKLSFSNGSNASNLSLNSSTTYRLMHIGSGFWQVEFVNGGQYSINGLPLNLYGQIITSQTDSTTTAYTKAGLNSMYNSLVFPIGIRIHCKDIVGGGLVYERITASEWISQPITLVS